MSYRVVSPPRACKVGEPLPHWRRRTARSALRGRPARRYPATRYGRRAARESGLDEQATGGAAVAVPAVTVVASFVLGELAVAAGAGRRATVPVSCRAGQAEVPPLPCSAVPRWLPACSRFLPRDYSLGRGSPGAATREVSEG
jgi:hypothetical protein